MIGKENLAIKHNDTGNLQKKSRTEKYPVKYQAKTGINGGVREVIVGGES